MTNQANNHNGGGFSEGRRDVVKGLGLGGLGLFTFGGGLLGRQIATIIDGHQDNEKAATYMDSILEKLESIDQNNKGERLISFCRYAMGTAFFTFVTRSAAYGIDMNSESAIMMNALCKFFIDVMKSAGEELKNNDLIHEAEHRQHEVYGTTTLVLVPILVLLSDRTNANGLKVDTTIMKSNIYNEKIKRLISNIQEKQEIIKDNQNEDNKKLQEKLNIEIEELYHLAGSTYEGHHEGHDDSDHSDNAPGTTAKDLGNKELGDLEERAKSNYIKEQSIYNDRPKFTSTPEERKLYLKKLQKRYVKDCSYTYGITGILCLLSTTYVGSSVTESEKDHFTYLANEICLAKKVLLVKGFVDERGSSNEAEVKEAFSDEHFFRKKSLLDVSEDAQAYINGPSGYTNLALTLSANIQGIMLLGDPPNFFYYMMYGIEGLKADMPLGAFNSSMGSTIALYAHFRGLGIPHESFQQYFLDGCKDTLSAIKDKTTDIHQTIFHTKRDSNIIRDKLRSVKLDGDSRSKAENLMKAMDNIDGYSISLNIDERRNHKKEYIEELLKKFATTNIGEKVVNLVGSFGRTLNNKQQNISSDIPEDLINELKQLAQELETLQDTKNEGTEKLVSGILHREYETGDRTGTVNSLSNVISVDGEDSDGAMGSQSESADKNDTEQKITFNRSKEDYDTIRTYFNNIIHGKKIDENDPSLSTITQAQLEYSKDKTEDNKKAYIQAIESYLNEGNKNENQTLIDNFFDLPEDIQIKVLVSYKFHAGQDEFTERHEGFFAHAAKEVLFALGTQIPAVPALIGIANDIIKKVTSGINDPLKLANTSLTVAYIIGGLLTMFADNVAAFLVIDKVIEKILIKLSGTSDGVIANASRQSPLLRAVLGSVAKSSAVIFGNGIKIANGANFSQELRKIINEGKEGKLQTKLEKRNLSLEASMIYNNNIAMITNSILSVANIGVGAYVLGMIYNQNRDTSSNNSLNGVTDVQSSIHGESSPSSNITKAFLGGVNILQNDGVTHTVLRQLIIHKVIKWDNNSGKDITALKTNEVSKIYKTLSGNEQHLVLSISEQLSKDTTNSDSFLSRITKRDNGMQTIAHDNKQYTIKKHLIYGTQLKGIIHIKN